MGLERDETRRPWGSVIARSPGNPSLTQHEADASRYRCSSMAG